MAQLGESFGLDLADALARHLELVAHFLQRSGPLSDESDVRRGVVRRLALEKVDGASALTSPLGPALIGLGFQEGPRRLTLGA